MSDQHDTRGPLFLDGTLYWPDPRGGYVKAIMGASNPDPGDGGGDDGGDGDSGGDDGGDGGQSKPKAKAKARAGDGGDGLADPVGDWFNALPPEGKQYFRDLKRTASGNSKKARDAQAQLDAIQQSTMTTEQRMQLELERERDARTRAESKLRESAIRTAFAREGSQPNVGALYPNELWRQVDPEDIRWDPETGEVMNAPELVANIKHNMPKLFESSRPTASVDAGTRQAPQQKRADGNEVMNALIRMRRT